jgi:hypothetical protein
MSPRGDSRHIGDIDWQFRVVLKEPKRGEI